MKRDRKDVIENLTWRHGEGRLLPELPYMKVAMVTIEGGKFRLAQKRAARKTFELACEVCGTTPDAVTYGNDPVGEQQVRIFSMIGPAMFLGSFATEQPADFYIDDRCGRFPYGKREIYAAVKTLVEYAKLKGLDPHNMPPRPLTHNMGVL